MKDKNIYEKLVIYKVTFLQRMLYIASMNSPSQHHRSAFLDQLRGLAVILMIIFHTAYDLTLFHVCSIDFQKESFWFYLPRIIVFIFLFCVGISLTLTHTPHFQWQKYLVRLGKIASLAVLISIITFLFFPTQWIYFGTLHCIATCSILIIPFLKRPLVSLTLGTILLLLPFFGLRIPWIGMKHASLDYIPLFPWLGVALLGITAFHWGITRISTNQIKIIKFLSLPGKYSLQIYLLHQPVIYGIIFLTSKLIGLGK